MDRMPSELIEFFSRGNNTLLVKGEPGTGKTILSLELLRRFSEEMNGIYLSTRVSPDRLLNQFPWLRDVVKSEHILETGKAGVEGGFRVSDSTIREFPTVLEHFYELAIGIENPFIVVDSWNAIADELEPDQIRTTMKILETLVASKNANLVFVSETPGESGLDYTVDGVVTLSAETLEDRRLRVIHLNKLRGVEIRHNAYLFTLKDGRFQHFPSFTRKYPEQPETYEPLPDSETHFSTGIEGLDRVLGGGYPRGSIVQMEIGGNVQTPEFEAFLLATARNFTLQGRGVLFVPCCGLDADYVFKLMERFGVGEKERLGLIKIFEREISFSKEEKPYTVPLDPTKSLMENFPRFVEAGDMLMERTNQPVLGIVGNDTIVSLWGEDMFREAASLTAMITRKTGNLTIGVNRPGLENITTTATSLADVHIKMMKMFGALILFGVKPQTCLYAMEVSNGYPTFTPIV